MSVEFVEKYNNSNIKPELCVIWLHGLGADCNDFLPIVNELKLNRSIKFVFPNAPLRAITINNGYVMRGWYDIMDLSRLDGAIDFVGINDSINQINQLIEKQIANGFDYSKIILAGFSQGGVISYLAGINHSQQLGGIMVLSCYLPDIKNIIGKSSSNITTPIFAAHGLSDPIVPYVIGKQASDALINAGYNLKWHEYKMPHSVCQEQIADIANWLNEL